jgi:hypothetical protein
MEMSMGNIAQYTFILFPVSINLGHTRSSVLFLWAALPISRKTII